MAVSRVCLVLEWCKHARCTTQWGQINGQHLLGWSMPPNVCSHSRCRNNGVTIHELPDDLLSQLPAIPLPNTDPLRSHCPFLHFSLKLFNRGPVHRPGWPTRNHFAFTAYVCLWSCREGKQQKGDLDYIKKPPNAFMLFLEEQRPFVTPELRRQGTSKVNKALGKRVSLKNEQTKKQI